MDSQEFLEMLFVAVVAAYIGLAFGYWYGRRIGILTQRTVALRRRRPISLTVDLDLIRYAAEGAGYDVVQKERKLH